MYDNEQGQIVDFALRRDRYNSSERKTESKKGFNVWVSLEVTLLISVETDSRVLEKKMDRAVTLAQDLIITRDIPVTGRLPKEGPIPQDPSKNVYPATNRNMFHCAANMFHCAEIET